MSTEPAVDDPLLKPSGTPSPLARPRVLDLLVLTACFSFFLGLCRYGFQSEVSFALWQLNDYEVLGYGLGVGLCWTGIFRLVFPGGGRIGQPPRLWQPGEVICVAEGGYYLVVAAMGAAFRLTLLDGAPAVADDAEPAYEIVPLALAYVLPAAAFCSLYVWLAMRVTTPYWRIGAIAKAAGQVVAPLLLVVMVSSTGDYFPTLDLAVYAAMLLCVGGPVLVILLAGWRDRRVTGVHWTHWMGLVAFAAIYLSRLSLEARALADLLSGE